MNELIKIGLIVLGPVQTNCYYIYSLKEEIVNGKRPCIVIDPADEGDLIYEHLTNQGLEVGLILLTHAHFDHIGGAERLRELSGAPIWCHEEEKLLCEDTDANLSAAFGNPIAIKVDKYLKDDELIEAANLKCFCIFTPGHTKGSCCYYFEREQVLFSGDTLFEGSVGRTDFPTGSAATLFRSVHDKLGNLPGNTKVFPGHGSETIIKDEKEYNQYMIN
ncbi:MBL fold metallo-hydrolase [Butyrivibrio sp. NC3005]|uniref:MBL fold metallo-hydrolase n=1 Tax=Butyrivibrio sp. NC3005 TaxID=1280685 RepID=UPI000424E8C1|nr:MBL fold metallo-hydrolase [Butyrivibrio sp. NC3005]